MKKVVPHDDTDIWTPSPGIRMPPIPQGFKWRIQAVTGNMTIVKLRSRSRSGEGQVRVRKLRELKTQRFGPEPYNKFGFHHPPPPPPPPSPQKCARNVTVTSDTTGNEGREGRQF